MPFSHAWIFASAPVHPVVDAGWAGESGYSAAGKPRAAVANAMTGNMTLDIFADGALEIAAADRPLAGHRSMLSDNRDNATHSCDSSDHKGSAMVAQSSPPGYPSTGGGLESGAWPMTEKWIGVGSL